MGTFLGINASHNGSVCVVRDGKVAFYIEEERLARVKRREGATLAVRAALSECERFDAAFYNATSSYQPQLEEVLQILSQDAKTAAIPKSYVQHHDSHALSAIYTSSFAGSEVLAVIIDHSGEQFIESQTKCAAHETESVYLLRGSRLELLYKRLATNVLHPMFGQLLEDELRNTYPGAEIVVEPFAGIAQCYGAVCDHLGYHHFEAGKIMGLAPYGLPRIQLLRGGHGDANLTAFQLPGFVGFHRGALAFPRLQNGAREIQPNMDRFYFDLAASVQHETMEAAEALMKRWVQATGVRRVCYAGGYALNSICNTYLANRMPEVEFWIMPVAHDGGTAIGCAYMGCHQANALTMPQPLRSISWGSTYVAENALAQFPQLKCQRITDPAGTAAEMISRGMTVAWHQGRSEAGPRALGNRSILSDPRKPDGRDSVNRLKGREWYRPLAGTVLAEEYSAWFVESGLNSDFMMFVVTCRHPERVPAMVHVDGTCRVQTIAADQNEAYYRLIRRFHEITGVPLILNTSFNPAGEPLCETPHDSVRAFLKMPQLDALFLDHLLVIRGN